MEKDIPSKGEKCSQPALDHKPEPLPEGGWGWIIVASVFCITVVIQKALGVFFVEWKLYFDASATAISWVVSLPPAVMGILSKYKTYTGWGKKSAMVYKR